eukprot:scaffold667204_cov52-Prasinocladus_malaysianus.AAC.1
MTSACSRRARMPCDLARRYKVIQQRQFSNLQCGSCLAEQISSSAVPGHQSSVSQRYTDEHTSEKAQLHRQFIAMEC